MAHAAHLHHGSAPPPIDQRHPSMGRLGLWRAPGMLPCFRSSWVKHQAQELRISCVFRASRSQFWPRVNSQTSIATLREMVSTHLFSASDWEWNWDVATKPRSFARFLGCRSRSVGRRWMWMTHISLSYLHYERNWMRLSFKNAKGRAELFVKVSDSLS